jgi:tetratricopeptide (TPR) repeat protein
MAWRFRRASLREALDRLPSWARRAVIAVYRAFERWSGGAAAVRKQRAYALWRAGASEAALSAMHEAIAASPGDPKLREGLVNFHSELGQTDRAMAVARLWLIRMPGSARAHFHMGRLLLTQLRYEAAMAHLERSQADPDLAREAGLMLVHIGLQTKNPQRALKELYQCIARPTSFTTQHADMILSLTQQLTTLRHFQAVADCCTAIEEVDRRDPLRLAVHAAALRDLGRTTEAEKLVQALLALQEESPDSGRMIRAYGALGRTDEAVSAARRWADAAPRSAAANWLLAHLLVRQKQHAQAQQYVDRALTDSAAPLDAGFEIVRLLLLANDVESAAALMEKLLKLGDRVQRHNAGPVVVLARTFHARRKYRVAEACCRATEPFRGQDPEFLTLHGNVLLSMGRVERARQLLERAVCLSPRSDRAPRLLLALGHFHEGNPELGKAYLSEAVGVEEEGKAMIRLFGMAAPLIQPFGSEIDERMRARGAA